MSAVVDAHLKVERLGRELDEARAELRQAVKQAGKQGEAVSETARRLGLSRPGCSSGSRHLPLT